MSFGQFYRNAAGDQGVRYGSTLLAGTTWMPIGYSDHLYDGQYINFNNVTIPKDATIYNAFIKFLSYDNQSGAVSSNIYGNDADDAASPTDSSEFDALVKTTATVAWSVEAWTASAWFKTPDISTIIQEIVNRASWASGNNLQIIMNTSASEGAYRTAYLEYSVSGPFWPHLDVIYEASGSETPKSRIITSL